MTATRLAAIPYLADEAIAGERHGTGKTRSLAEAQELRKTQGTP